MEIILSYLLIRYDHFQGLPGKSGAPGDNGIQGLPVSDFFPHMIGHQCLTFAFSALDFDVCCHFAHAGFAGSVWTKRTRWYKGATRACTTCVMKIG